MGIGSNGQIAGFSAFGNFGGFSNSHLKMGGGMGPTSGSTNGSVIPTNQVDSEGKLYYNRKIKQDEFVLYY